MKTVWPKRVGKKELERVAAQRHAVSVFLGQNWAMLENLGVAQKIQLQALELMYVSAHSEVFGFEPDHLPTRRQDQAMFLVDNVSSKTSSATRRVA